MCKELLQAGPLCDRSLTGSMWQLTRLCIPHVTLRRCLCHAATAAAPCLQGCRWQHVHGAGKAAQPGTLQALLRQTHAKGDVLLKHPPTRHLFPLFSEPACWPRTPAAARASRAHPPSFHAPAQQLQALQPHTSLQTAAARATAALGDRSDPSCRC